MKIDEPNTPYHYYEEPTPDEIQQSISIGQFGLGSVLGYP